MSWSRSSKLGLAVLCLALIAAVGVASAASVTQEDVPAEAEPGTEITASVELGELYSDNQQWQLDGQTELGNANWTVQLHSSGNVTEHTARGTELQPVTINQSAEDAPGSVTVEVTGTVPEPDTWSYSEPPSSLALELAEVANGGDDVTIIDSWEVEQYASGDPGSREARSTLTSAQEAIDSARSDGVDVSEAESTFDQAVQAYEAGNFGFAVTTAEQAESQAQPSDTTGSGSGGTTDGGSETTDGGSGTTDGGSETIGGASEGSSTSDGGSGAASSGGSEADGAAENSSDGDDDGGILPIVLYALLGLLILGAVGGGVYYYQQQQGPSRDPLG